MSDLAPYACHPDQSRGRQFPQPPSAMRTMFQRDRDRIIHCAAFRRLKHKTQVFVYHEGDHYRTRLTHSLEVAQIARTLARALALNEDLAEALALAHDLGHTAFGHAGEEALAARMSPYDGFDHNAQTIRIVTHLEERYAAFNGLNLTWETLEGLAKHNGPVSDPPFALAQYQTVHDLELNGYPSAEAQIAAIADDIAYDNHDIDDGLRAGLFTLEELRNVPLVARLWDEVAQAWPSATQERQVQELIRMLIGAMVEDVFAETCLRLTALQPNNADDIRRSGHPIAGFSSKMAQDEGALKTFLRDRMYRHPVINKMTANAKQIVTDLFDAYHAQPERLPTEWRPLAPLDRPVLARRIADFIAGMTDRYAMAEHQRLFSTESSS
jgi:dGTPase